MGHNMVLGCDYSYNKQKGFGGEWMYLLRGPLWWPCGCIGAMAIHMTTPDAEWQMLHWKPLDLDDAIRWLLAPYCPGSHQGNNLQNDNEQVHTQFAGHFDGNCHCGVAVRYQVHRLMEDEVHGFLLEATRHHHWASIHSDNKNWTCWDHFFVFFFYRHIIEKGCEVRKRCPLLTIWVWNIKMMRSSSVNQY